MGSEASGTITIPESMNIITPEIVPPPENIKQSEIPIIEEASNNIPAAIDKPIEEKRFEINPEVYRANNQIIVILAGHNKLPPKYGGKINFVKVDEDGYLYCKCEKVVKEVIREVRTEVKEIQTNNMPVNINLKSEIKIDLWRSLKDIFQNIKAFFRRCLNLRG